MKQVEDTKTVDFLGVPNRRGRPAKYANAAEKQAAYLARKGVAKQVNVLLSDELAEQLQVYMDREARDGRGRTQSEVICDLLAKQLFRKR